MAKTRSMPGKWTHCGLKMCKQGGPVQVKSSIWWWDDMYMGHVPTDGHEQIMRVLPEPPLDKTVNPFSMFVRRLASAHWPRPAWKKQIYVIFWRGEYRKARARPFLNSVTRKEVQLSCLSVGHCDCTLWPNHLCRFGAAGLAIGLGAGWSSFWVCALEALSFPPLPKEPRWQEAV